MAGGDEGLAALVENADGSYLLGGDQGGDYWIVKINRTGTQQWERSYGGEGPESLSALIKTPDGGYLLGGSGKYRGTGNNDTCGEPLDYGYAIWIVRINSNGEAQWDKAFFGSPFLGTIVNDFLNALIPTNDGGYLLGGTSRTNRGNHKTESSWGGSAFNLCDHGGVNHGASADYWIIKLNGDGSQQWDKDFGGYGTDALSALVQDADGSFVLAGHSDSGADGDKTQASQGGNDYWVVKTNPGPPCPSLTFTPATNSGLPPAIVGQAYRQAIATDSTGYAFTATGLPAGLSISAEGIITGTPRIATASPDTVSVTATRGACQAKATYLLAVNKGNGEPLVVSFTLIDARTGTDLQPLKEGDLLNLLLLPDQLSVRANTDPVEVGSVVFGLNNKPTFRVENFVPYALASNKPDGSYVAYPFQSGEYALTATPNSQEKGQGKKGLALSIHFRVVRPGVTSFTLINAATDEDIRPLKADDVLDLSTLPDQLSVRANTEPAEVGSVVFGLNGQAAFQVDNLVPYALAGNNPDGTYLPYAFQTGEYALTATPYSQEKGQGRKGLALSIRLQVVRSKVASFTLINTATGEDIQPLEAGDVLDLATLPAQLSVRANPQPSQVGSVIFGLNDQAAFRVDNQVPYALTGNNPDGHYLFFTRIGEGQIGGSKAVAVDGSGNLFVVDRDKYRILKFDSSGTYLGPFGSQGGGEGQFGYPEDVALDSNGNLLVSDTYNHSIVKFSPSGSFLSKFGRYGNFGGRFNNPLGVAIDGSGKIYVADRYNYRIQKFYATGGYHSQFGRQGSAEGQFQEPISVAVDGSGNIYVLDAGARIQKFSSSFSFLANIGSTGTGEGQFQGPRGLAVDRFDNLFVADTRNGIQKFDSSGHFLTKFGAGIDVTVDGSGIVYVADEGGSVAKYSPSGSYLPYAFQVGQQALTATPYSQANGLGEKGLALTVNFQVVNSASVTSITLVNAATGGDIQPLKAGDVLDLATLPDQLSVRAYTQPSPVGSVVFGLNDKPTLRVENSVPYALAGAEPGGRFLLKFGREGSGEGQFQFSNGVAVDGSGNIYVQERENRIQKFDSQGRFLFQFGSEGSGEGQFNQPWGVALDRSDNLYVVDQYNNRIQQFDSSGRFLFQFGSQGSDDGQLNLPACVVVDGSGNLLVTDHHNHRIQKFSSSGMYLGQFGSPGSGEGQFNDPGGIAVDGSGNLYVGDRNNHRIQKFDSSGRFLLQFGSEGSGEGQFSSPWGVAVDSLGNLFVADDGNHRIQQFSPSGRFISKFGIEGSGDGQFRGPLQLAMDDSGNLYVVDTGNHRIQKFSPSDRYFPYAFQVGDYALTVTPYKQANGQGVKGSALTVDFQVVNSASTARTSDGEAGASLQVMAYPNPFNEKVYAVIKSAVRQGVEVHCYDAKGVEVGRMYEGELEAGQEHLVEVDGRTWPEGLYFLRVSTPQEQLVKKIMRQRK